MGKWIGNFFVPLSMWKSWTFLPVVSHGVRLRSNELFSIHQLYTQCSIYPLFLPLRVYFHFPLTSPRCHALHWKSMKSYASRWLLRLLRADCQCKLKPSNGQELKTIKKGKYEKHTTQSSLECPRSCHGLHFWLFLWRSAEEHWAKWPAYARKSTGCGRSAQCSHHRMQCRWKLKNHCSATFSPDNHYFSLSLKII